MFVSCLFSVKFSEISTENLRIYFDESQREISIELMNILQNQIDNFQRKISQYPKEKLTITISPDKRYYMTLIKNKNKILEYSDAFYDKNRHSVYVRNISSLNFSRLSSILFHEYIHFFVDTYFKNAPLWFHEGMAVYFSDPVSYMREINYAFNHIFGKIPKITNMIRNYPTNRAQWESFYAKSYLVVKYMYTNDRDSFYDLWDYSEEYRGDFYGAFNRSHFLGINVFYVTIEEMLKKRLKIEIFMSISGIIWSFLPLLLIISWVRKKILMHKLLKRWGIEEEQNKLINLDQNS